MSLPLSLRIDQLLLPPVSRPDTYHARLLLLRGRGYTNLCAQPPTNCMPNFLLFRRAPRMAALEDLPERPHLDLYGVGLVVWEDKDGC